MKKIVYFLQRMVFTSALSRSMVFVFPTRGGGKMTFIRTLRFLTIGWVIGLIPSKVNAQADSIRILLSIPDTINTVFVSDDANFQFEGISDTSIAQFEYDDQKLEIKINDKWYLRVYLADSYGISNMRKSLKYPILIDLFTIYFKNYSELSQFITTGGQAQIKYSCPIRTSDKEAFVRKSSHILNLNIPAATPDDRELLEFIHQMKDSIPSFSELFYRHRVVTDFEFNAYRDIRDKFPNSILNEVIILQYQESICGAASPHQILGQDLLDETKNVHNRLKQSKFNWIRNNLDLLEWYISK